MRRRHLTAVLSTVAGMALAAAVVAPAQAAAAHARHATKSSTQHAPPRDDHRTRGRHRHDAPAEDSFHVAGTVSAVDAEADTLTLTRPGRKGTITETIPVAGDATVTLDGDAASLADLPAGARVRMNGSEAEDTRTATEIKAITSWPMRIQGTIAGIDPTAGTLTVTVGGRRGTTSTTTVSVGADVPVTLDGAASTLAGLAAGARVRVLGRGTVGGTTVTAVHARSMPAAAIRPRRRH
jgi:hypothetical protein